MYELLLLRSEYGILEGELRVFAVFTRFTFYHEHNINILCSILKKAMLGGTPKFIFLVQKHKITLFFFLYTTYKVLSNDQFIVCTHNNGKGSGRKQQQFKYRTLPLLS